MTTSVRDLQERRFGATLRRDAWWIAPALTALVLGSFAVYATWAAWVTPTMSGARICRRSIRL